MECRDAESEPNAVVLGMCQQLKRLYGPYSDSKTPPSTMLVSFFLELSFDCISSLNWRLPRLDILMIAV